MDQLTLVSSHSCFNGTVGFYRHHSETIGAPMRFSAFVPAQAAGGPLPVVYWLSGLTCTEENFTVKAGAQRYAAEHAVILVAPDTSPRDTGIPGERGEGDVGEGAGFYVNATREPWSRHYRMFDYVVQELPRVVEAHFPARTDRRGIMGHSMGGHGALVAALRHPERFASVSAFAPICAPSEAPWGQKAFTAYLGPDKAAWREWDATQLVARSQAKPLLLIDQGDADPFLAKQLMPERLLEACRAAGHPVTYRLREGYDHSYYFVASFIGQHVAHHARILHGHD